MRRCLIFVLIFVLMTLPSTASAQAGTKLDSINIELWSEYDQPSMLVIYQFVVSQETTLPTDVTLRFPREGNLVAVAAEENGELFNKDFTPPVEQDDWQIIKVTVESYAPHRIEYYQPLSVEGNTRRFEYRSFGDYAAREFMVTVLVPSDSTRLVTSPVLESRETVANGLLIAGSVTRKDLRMGNSFKFEVTYDRATTTLVRPDPTAPVAPVAPVNEDTPGRVSIANLPWIIGAFGLALIGIALFSYWRSTQSGESQPRRRRRHKAEEDDEVQAYCHECGARAQASDRFCRTCGSRLRGA